jgi:hypothetical protein
MQPIAVEGQPTEVTYTMLHHEGWSITFLDGEVRLQTPSGMYSFGPDGGELTCSDLADASVALIVTREEVEGFLCDPVLWDTSDVGELAAQFDLNIFDQKYVEARSRVVAAELEIDLRKRRC